MMFRAIAVMVVAFTQPLHLSDPRLRVAAALVACQLGYTAELGLSALVVYYSGPPAAGRPAK